MATQSEVVLEISGMTCASCVARVEKGLENVPGVTASVNLVTNSARVEFPSTVTTAQLVQAVSSLGYTASVAAEGRYADFMSGMKTHRLNLVLASALLTFFGLFFTIGSSAPALASTDDFSFESMTVNYVLDRSPTGDPILTTQENLVAVFPEEDQNHGIQRAIPLSYQGRSTNPTITAVSDGEGRDLAYTSEEVDGFLVVTIRDDNFLHGRVHYSIGYTQSNVIVEPSDAAGIQEFYWDVNGTGWAQPFGFVSAQVTVSPELSAALTADSACYQGGQGDGTPCSTASSETSSSGERVFNFAATDLAPYATLSFAIGFEPGTFVFPDTSLWVHPLGAAFATATALMFGLFVFALVMRLFVWRNARGRGIVIAQYEAPEGVTPVLAATIMRLQSRAIVASLLRLAVDRKIVIRDANPGRKRGGFEIRLVSASDLSAEDTLVVQAAFGPAMVVDSTFTTSTPDTARARRFRRVWTSTKASSFTSGFRTKPQRALRGWTIALSAVTTVAVFVLGGIVLADGYGGGSVALVTFLFNFVLTLTTILLLAIVAPLTELGAQTREHLTGLKLFIRLAEADRIAFLQSPEGAQRRPDPTKTGEMIHLYEKALPYAVLFGLEKQWASELGSLYVQESRSPYWYSTDDDFAASAFVIGMTSLSASATTWASSESSSSSSGSSGGGFAGGGGGGGGGGGV